MLLIKFRIIIYLKTLIDWENRICINFGMVEIRKKENAIWMPKRIKKNRKLSIKCEQWWRWRYE